MPTEKKTRTHPTTAVYWLITKDRDGRSETMTIGDGGEKMLPVFSFREEAEMFLSFETWGEGWAFRRVTAGELVSILAGPCAGAGSVALDPMPESAFRGMTRLVSLSRERFLSRIVEKASLETAETRPSENPDLPSSRRREPTGGGFPPRGSRTGVWRKGTLFS